MKILHIIAQKPSLTGSGVYYSNVVQELAKFGHEQAALFACQDGYQFGILPESRQYAVKFKTESLPFPIAGMSDVMPYENTVYSQMSEEMLTLWSSAFGAKLRQAQAQFNPDAVIMHHLWMLTSMAAEVFAGKIKIGVCHNTDIRQAEQHPGLKEKYVTNLPSLDTVFCLSEGQKQTIVRVFGIDSNKIINIGGGFDERLFYPASHKRSNQPIRLVFSAKIEQSKGVFELVKAFKLLEQTKPHVRLDIIGTPNEENAYTLRDLIGGDKNIAVIPIKCQKELADYIRDKDIFVMPSYFEGLGLMAIECLACGLRVVATEIEALRQLLGDTVNSSGIIEYVALPRIYGTDKPYEQDIPEFVQRLHAKLLLQVERIEKGQPFPPGMLAEIGKHSWGGVVARINEIIIKAAN